ncbi:LOW QUALITY PROTEIN: dihydrodiol dehydrogenase, tandem duplicate 1 [Xenentodon cancila]
MNLPADVWNSLEVMDIPSIMDIPGTQLGIISWLIKAATCLSLSIQFNKATRWELCGAGKISHDFSVAIKTLPPEDHQIAAIASRSTERAQDFARKHNIPMSYSSWPVIRTLTLCTCWCCTQSTGDWSSLSQSREDLVTAAKKNDFFLREVTGCLFCPFQAIWSRCVPVVAEVRMLLPEEAVGEVKPVKTYFGSPQLHFPRSVKKELGGGALLDIVYCRQFVLMVFNGERPESIQAKGVLLYSGVDEWVVVRKFSRSRMALAFSIGARLPNDAVISGTTGSVEILGPMHCPTTLVVNNKTAQDPLPEPCLPPNFTNSTGLRYQAEEVRQSLLNGLKESHRMPLADSVLLTEIMDEIRKQVVVFGQDSQ